MSEDKNQKKPGAKPPVESPGTDNTQLEQAVSILAEQVEVISHDLKEVKEQLEIVKKSGSVAIAKPQSNEPIKLPVFNIDGERWQCRFPSFYVGKDKMTAEQLVKDEATLRALMADKPNLFVKL